MSKAEQFIKDYTRNCSNELCYEEGLGNLYEPWLTPDKALRAVELAREEIKAEIERLIKSYSPIQSSEGKYRIEAYKEVLDIINSNCLNISRSGNSRIEAMKEALRMEYEKGRADAIAEISKMSKEVDSQIWQIANNSAKTWEQSFAILQATQTAYNKGKMDALKEQKPTDKTEPKFHEGEWIIHQGTENIYQVVACVDNQYQLKYGDNYTTQYCEDVDRCARLWDITKDAKDGDVLYSLDTNRPFIYKARNIHEQATAYCGINKYGKFFVWNTNDCIITLNKYIPATKEQRDTLMKAMTDAGYTFDFEKKELKEIEDKPLVIDEGKDEIDRNFTEMMLKDYTKQKSAWSEKGRADVLRCIDPDEMVADFCSQPLSKTRSLASIYRQGIIDIIKRINRNEETSITSTHSIDDGGVQLPKP